MAAAVNDALARSGVDPLTIGFVEAHGTGTAFGDPIELGALAQASAASTPETAFCAVGSVKTNVGHLQIASGVAGFIKAALAVYHRKIPATLHFEEPNPRIDFANSPFLCKHLLARLVSRRAAAAGGRQFHGDRRHQCACRSGRTSTATTTDWRAAAAAPAPNFCANARRAATLVGRYRETLRTV